MQATETPTATASLTPSVTPTPTWESLFPSSTPIPTLNYKCPDAPPAGWGTVTPSVKWNYECGPCLLTLTPTVPTATSVLATSTPGGPTFTPSPTPSPTPTEAEYYPLEIVWLGATYTGPVHQRTSAIPASYSGAVTIPINPEDAGRLAGVIWIYSATTSGSGLSTANLAGVALPNGYRGNTKPFGLFYLPVSVEMDGGEFNYQLDQLAKRTAGMSDYDAEAYASLTGTVFQGSTLSLSYSGQMQGDWSHVYTIQMGISGYIVLGDAAPEPVPSYCDAVEDGTLDGVWDLGVELPDFKVGAPLCYGVGAVGPINLPLIGEISWPGILVCFRAITFGTLNFLGVLIDLDFLSFVIAGIMGLRWVMRS